MLLSSNAASVGENSTAHGLGYYALVRAVGDCDLQSVYPRDGLVLFPLTTVSAPGDE